MIVRPVEGGFIFNCPEFVVSKVKVIRHCHRFVRRCRSRFRSAEQSRAEYNAHGKIKTACVGNMESKRQRRSIKRNEKERKQKHYLQNIHRK